MMKFLLPLLAVLLAGCAQNPRQPDNGQPVLSASEAQVRYEQGLARYLDSRFDTALGDLNAAVSSGNLKSADALNARKHMAFIHCISNREAQCREQFETILKADSNFDLAPNEAGHPAWGPVWRSIKGNLDDKRAVVRGSGMLASSAQQKLAEGIKEYDAGRYKEALNALHAAIKNGLSDKTDEIRAHKYAAFTHCLMKNGAQCRTEFRTIFSVNPAFELLPSEAGHPAWAAIYRRELAAARHANKIKPAIKK
ncbi:MAG: hypothetical protein JWQ21_1227 [Herminiimonas sp.]|nr:hypothetical protein [Herminiimonas sp.]